MLFNSPPIVQRVKKLQVHLQRENPLLLDVVRSFRLLDKVAVRLGIIDPNDSFTTRVPWWPMISILGTFSAGKSTFINAYLQTPLQQTGNQAVDDKFTVICYGGEEPDRVLPGRALDADPRFPFYQMSRELDGVAPGEGQRVDAYMQLKTCQSERLRGKILIDSPGFDADEQRNATLRLTDHIMDLSDIVLVFFDARHPEPGAMQDTLSHLVQNTIGRHDSSKFLFILNQIDNAAREDNPEEVFAAWQRGLAQKGLTAGRFYSIYNTEAAIHIEDPVLRERFESKRDADMAAIEARLNNVEVERAYRIIGVLDQTAKLIENKAVPALRGARVSWHRRVLWIDIIVFGLIGAGLVGFSVQAGYWQWDGLLPRFTPAWLEPLLARPWLVWFVAGGVTAIGIYLHYSLRRIAAQWVAADLARNEKFADIREWLLCAFQKNTRFWHFAWYRQPMGWTALTRRRLTRVLNDADRFVQSLNNRFADPSGVRTKPTKAAKTTLAAAQAGNGKSPDKTPDKGDSKTDHSTDTSPTKPDPATDLQPVTQAPPADTAIAPPADYALAGEDATPPPR